MYNPKSKSPIEDPSETAPSKALGQTVWFIDLQKTHNNREALKVNKVGRQRVRVEMPRKNIDMRQCYGCF